MTVLTEWARVTGPVIEPVTLDDLKRHIGVTQADDDAVIDSYRVAAREAAESYLFAGLLTQTWRLKLSTWADTVWLPMAAPLASVTSVTYYDADGTLTTLSSSYYVVETTSSPGSLLRAPGVSWPSLQTDRRFPITVTYVCGATDPADVAEAVKQGIRLYAASFEADRLGGSDDARAARMAAEREWDRAGVVRWREPETCRD